MPPDSPITQRAPYSLTELLMMRAAEQPDRVGYVFLQDETTRKALTYGELERAVRALAARLSNITQPGDRALLLYPAGLDFVVSFFACLYARLIAAPLPLPAARQGLEKIALVAQDTGARLALTTAALVEKGRGSLPALRWEATNYKEAGPEGTWRPLEAGASDIAYLQYTSGSTSAPRGVIIDHGNVLHNLANIDLGFGHTEASVAVTWLPHFHDMGLIYGLLAPLHGGFPCYLMPPAAFVEKPLVWLQAITRFRATHSGGPNFAYDLCVRRIRPEERAGLDLSSWEVAFNGAEPVQAETLERFAEAFEGCGFRRSALHPAYGLAEASLKVTGGSKGRPPVVFAAKASALAANRVEPAEPRSPDQRLMVGCGRAGLDTRVVIVDPESFRECPEGTVGEIWVSGPGVARGYWNRPGETRETFGALLSGDGEGPFLRTGDLGFLRDGELFVAGRLKDLIIIRGLNHHPADIELTARRAYPALASSIAAAFALDAAGREEAALVMEAPRKSEEELAGDEVAAAIRQAVAERHELRLHSFVLVRKGAIPRTSSGKIQRRLCRSLYLERRLDIIYESILEEREASEKAEAPNADAVVAASPEERRGRARAYLISQFARTLKVPAGRLEPSRAVTGYGLDSLMVVELQNRVEGDLGVPFPAAVLIEGATIDELAAKLSEALAEGRGASPAIAARNACEGPLSLEQERLWLLDQVAPGNPAYHIPFAVRLRGPLDVALLANSAEEVIKRHDALRTFFPGGGRPVAVVAPPQPVRLESEEASGLEDAMERATAQARAPFDLKQGPLFRLRLFRISGEDHLCLLVMHHAVADIWSLRMFLEELFAVYGALAEGQAPALEPLPIQYGDFAVWQREHLGGEQAKRLSAWWTGHLEGAPRLELPADRPRPKRPTFRGGSEPFSFPPDVAAELRALSARSGVTLFTTLLAGFEALLARWSGQTDVVIGTTSANRNRAELERLIGFLAAPLILRVSLRGDPSFGEIVERVRAETVAAYAHQELPFAKVIEAVHPGRESSYTPLFRVMFSVVKPLVPDIAVPDLALEPLEIDPGATDFDLFLNVVDDPRGLRGFVVFSTDLYERATIQGLIRAYCSLLAEAVRAPETRLSLLAGGLAEAKPVIVVAATFTAEPVEEVLTFWMRELGFNYEIRFAPYNQVFQQLLDPTSMLAANTAGTNVILLRPEGWASADAAGFGSAVRAAAARTGSPFVVVLCPPLVSAGASDAEEVIALSLEGATGVHMVRPAEIRALYPVADFYDAHGDQLGHVPYTPEFFAALGTVIARKIHALRAAPFKVIALDCDHTLWFGVCGEDGPHGIVIDAPRWDLQEFMVRQRDSGMLLCLASKNNEEDVLATFAAHPEMPLRPEHFVARRLNWRPKSESLRALAVELDLGLESFIFVDDSPTECAEVEANCPNVLALRLPQDAGAIPGFLRHVWAFDHLRTTEEDRQRAAMYGQRLERIRLQHEVATLAEFLDALNLQVTIQPVTADQLPRVVQLTQRTNQMNFTTIRRSEGELVALLGDEKWNCLTVDVKDRFGSYGLVGVAIAAAETGQLAVDTFLLSCRALGRGVEHRMLAALGKLAADRGLAAVELRYAQTSKNRPALDFLESVAGEFEAPAAGGYRYTLPADYARAITYQPDAKPGAAEERPAAPAAGVSERAVNYERIANELSDARGILESVRAARLPVTAAHARYEAPRTPLERQLAEIWAEMLQVPKVGVNDNFFDLGGHSLLAVQLLSRVREDLEVDLSLDVVFAGNFCVAELARAIEIHEIEQASPEEYQALLAELEGLSDEEVRALIEEEERRAVGGDPNRG